MLDRREPVSVVSRDGRRRWIVGASKGLLKRREHGRRARRRRYSSMRVGGSNCGRVADVYEEG